MTNNLWEQSNIQANCQICDNDQPYYSPILPTDLVALRLTIPKYLVNLNSGGLPIGASVSFDIVDELGTTVLATLGAANSTQFILGYQNNGSNSDSQYQIYSPIPFIDPNGAYYRWRYADVNAGQHVVITRNSSTLYDFIYGVDQLPESIYEIQPGRIAFPFNAAGGLIIITVTLDGTTVTSPLLFPSSYSQTTYTNFYNCFRFRLTVNFATAGVVKTYYTKPYRFTRCGETTLLQGIYRQGIVDCNGYEHQSSWNVSVIDPTNLFIRVPADLERESNRIKKTYNSKCYNFKSERTKRFRLKSDPLPEYIVDEVEGLMMAGEFRVNNLPLMMDDAENVFVVPDIMGRSYQNIDVPLSLCKCELTFVC